VRPPSSALFDEALHLLVALRDVLPGGLQWDGAWFGQPGTILVDRYAGTPALREAFDGGASAAELREAFAPEAAAFASSRAPFLLYD